MQHNNQPLTIFFGDTQEHLSLFAKFYNPSAWKLDKSNYKKIINNEVESHTVVYTSLALLPTDLTIVWSILLKATTIFYCPPETWSDGKTIDIVDPTASIEGLTQILLSLLPNNIQINNLNNNIQNPNPLVAGRKTESSQMWVAGCSISHGTGVAASERYGQLLADELNIPCSFLTRNGSSIDWAADQILRSDIRAADLVIFGVTNPERFTHIHNNQLLNGITANTYVVYPEYKKIVGPENLYSQQTVYTGLYAIEKVINYCYKIDAQLFLVGINSGGHGLLPFLKFQKNYVNIPYNINFKKNIINQQFIDVGSDDIHPGPKQHLQYKQEILKHINNKNF
jgi:hypothetical protein